MGWDVVIDGWKDGWLMVVVTVLGSDGNLIVILYRIVASCSFGKEHTYV